MAKLTDDEQKLLEQLQAKVEAPDEPRGGGGRDLSIIVDLSDEAAVKRALRLGVLERGDLDEFDAAPVDGGGDEDDEKDGAGKKDRSPKRRLSIADKAMGAKDE